MIHLTVNGHEHQIEAEPDTPLLYVLRDELGLHGAKYGCGLGQCGACTVIVDGQAVFFLSDPGCRAAWPGCSHNREPGHEPAATRVHR